jgi:cell division protein FtsI (penicillin-binding protein 3)
MSTSHDATRPVKAMTPGVSQAARLRAYLTAAIVTLGLCGVASRAWSLQIDEGDKYRALADRQHETLLAIPAPRGDIVDARGRPLAVSADVDSVWANPHDIHDVTATADQLSKLLGIDAGTLESRLGADHKFVWLGRHVTPEVGKAVRDAKLPGVEVAREPRRWYPARALVGPVIGRSDIDGSGVDGLELSMNELLAGRRGAQAALRDARGHTMLADGLAPTSEPGATVRVSMDRSIQAIADEALSAQMTLEKAKNGVVVVLDVETARVLAMSSYPTYDPNAEDAHAARNRPVTDSYEPGSVMKVFSVATALEAGVVKPDTSFNLDGGKFVMAGATIRDDFHDDVLDVGGIIKRSSNVGAAKIALRMGSPTLYAGLKRFGFGARTDIELPGEQVGVVRDASKWREVDLAHIAFGYGVTVTPIQLAAAFATLARGGTYIEPRVVDQVTDADGNILYAPKPETHRAVSEQTATQMMTMLNGVFDKDPVHGGTAREVVVPGFVCAGKTGTARKWDAVAKQYSTTRYLSSFAGVAPYDHPKIVVVVMIDEASNGDYFGAKVSGPVFATVASETLRYLGVPGDALPPPKTTKPSTSTKTATATSAVAATSPSPSPSLSTSTGVPDFANLGVGKALDLARMHHLAVDLAGSGRVISQDPAPGAAGSRVTLRFGE